MSKKSTSVSELKHPIVGFRYFVSGKNLEKVNIDAYKDGHYFIYESAYDKYNSNVRMETGSKALWYVRTKDLVYSPKKINTQAQLQELLNKLVKDNRI